MADAKSISKSVVPAISPASQVSPEEPRPGVRGGLNSAKESLPNLKGQTARGAAATFICQGVSFGMRIVSMMVLARLLVPKDFGLVGMVTAVTGFLTLFKDAGLANATVQSASVTHEQLSTLFWINTIVGCALGLACAAIAPAVASFYGEPRLFWITIVAGASFVFNGLAAQHRAILMRNMRIPVIGIIEVISLVVSIAVSIGMAVVGFGYWALVASLLILPAGTLAGVWLATGWVPGRPRKAAGMRRMLMYGGTVTLNSLVVYLAYNVDKLLLGRFWGAEVLGIYGRAYSLIDLPTNSLHATVGAVAFPALSRVQNDPGRLRNYFLRIYGLFLTLTLPVTVVCALFSEDIVRVALGPKWHDAAIVFRLLAPTILVFAVINPLGWLMFATGHVVRSLKIALLIAPVVIVGYVLGLKHGPNGVAIGFSTAMVLLLFPVVWWAIRGTLITVADVTKTLMQPSASILAAAGIVFFVRPWIADIGNPLVRLTVATTALFSVYSLMLLFVFKQKAVYLELLEHTGLWPLGRRQGK